MEPHQGMFMGQHEDDRYESQLPFDIPNQDESSDEEEEEKIINSVILPGIKKRKRLSLSQLREVKVEKFERQSSNNHKTKKPRSKTRWSAKRYKLAEQSMWEVLKAEGATFENPITRPALRMAARTRISDTGLLDHLLKHIEGEVSPGGTDRFRRCFNPNGIMQYWLESADLDRVSQKAGVPDRSAFSEGSTTSQNTDSSNELELLKKEMVRMKKDMQELIAKQQQKSKISLAKENCKEFVNCKAAIDHSLTEIIASVKDVQGKYGEFANWKTKVEQQLVEITNKLNDLKASKESLNISLPSEKWKDWMKSTNLNNIQEDELATWIGSSELLNVPQEVAIEDPNSALPTQLHPNSALPTQLHPNSALPTQLHPNSALPTQLHPNSALPTQLPNQEMTNKKSSDLLEVVPMRQEDQPNVTPDSSTTVNSKSDHDNSLIMFQEMFMDIFKWREKLEQQLYEVSNTAYGMLAMK